MIKYSDYVIKECDGRPDEYFHIDMSKEAIVGSRMLAGVISHRIMDESRISNKSYEEVHKELFNKKIMVCVDSMAMAYSRLSPGFLIMFDIQCVEDLPENWGLTITKCF
jgi:hypothetical protein